MSEPIRILLADDHPLLLTGLKTYLAEKEALVIAGEARDGHETKRLSQTLEPDIVLLDLDMPPLPAHEVIDYLRTHIPTTKIIVLTGYEHDNYLSLILADIAGYVLKEEPPEAVYQAICTAMRGGAWFSQRIMRKLTEQRNKLQQI